jgi:DnaK suppressor protein
MPTDKLALPVPIDRSDRIGQLAESLHRLRRSRCAELFRMIDGHRADSDIEIGLGTEEETQNAAVDVDVDFTVIQMKSKEVASIDWALRQLQEGVYGRCADCQGEIAVQRLEAIPFARRCTGCQALAEQGLV